MISITLNFSSIEAARKVLLEIPSSALAGAPATEEAPAPKPVKAAKPAPAPVVAPPPPTVEPEAAPAPVVAPVAIDYPTLQKAVFALAGKSRDSAAAVAASLGVKTFKELGQEKWADALAAVSDKLAELEAA